MSGSRFACAHCNAATTPTPVSFLGPDEEGTERLWTVTVNLCRRPACLERRGAVATTNLRGPGAG